MRKRYPYIIVGSGVAGNAALEKLVALGEKGNIFMISRDKHLPYDRPPLSKEFLRGKRKEEKVFYHTEGYFKDNGVDIALDTSVKEIGSKEKVVITSSGEEIAFDKLLMTPGVMPLRFKIKGTDLENIFYLRSLDDSKVIKDAMGRYKSAVIVGGGFIGMEVAAALVEKGIAATLLTRGRWLWDRFINKEIASFFEDYYKRQGVNFIVNDEPVEFIGEGSVKGLRTKDGRILDCDFVVAGIGTELPGEIFLSSGLAFDNGLVVDEYMQTNNPDIFGAGDAINFYDPVFKKRRRVEHWGHADYSGRLAAENMKGVKKPYDLLTYVFSRVFDLRLEFAGNETDWEEIKIIRGSFGDKSFTALYLKNGLARAYFQINGEQAERAELERRIRDDLGE
jgi:NADPH-dependent 2,4-dienoyl-CoA reductase/sulfur reductase-like enzyme